MWPCTGEEPWNSTAFNKWNDGKHRKIWFPSVTHCQCHIWKSSLNKMLLCSCLIVILLIMKTKTRSDSTDPLVSNILTLWYDINYRCVWLKQESERRKYHDYRLKIVWCMNLVITNEHRVVFWELRCFTGNLFFSWLSLKAWEKTDTLLRSWICRLDATREILKVEISLWLVIYKVVNIVAFHIIINETVFAFPIYRCEYI